MAYPISLPSGYIDPTNFIPKVVVTGLASTSQGALNSIQDNVLGVGFDLYRIKTDVETVNTNVIKTYDLLNKQQIAFTSFSTSVAKFDYKVGNMEPLVITQSISFLLGAFVALAFVLATKMRL